MNTTTFVPLSQLSDRRMKRASLHTRLASARTPTAERKAHLRPFRTSETCMRALHHLHHPTRSLCTSADCALLAPTGRVKATGSKRFDCTLTDVALPGISGLELARRAHEGLHRNARYFYGTRFGSAEPTATDPTQAELDRAALSQT